MTSPVTSARFSLRTLCSQLLSVLLVLACAVPASAAAVKFDIPAQTADKALPQFIAQSDVSVMFNRADLKGVQLNAVVGEYEPEIALGHLLSGSGFAATRTGGGKYAVVKEAALTGTVDGSVREAKTARPVAGAKVAIAGTDKTAVTDNRGRFTISEVRPGDYELTIIADGMRNTQVTDVTVKAGHRHSLSAIEIPVKQEGAFELEPYRVSAKKNDGVVELDPYAVEGRKEKPFVSGNLDIPRTINDVQPYYIVDSRVIESSGAVNIEDLLKQRLSMNTLARTNSQQMSDTADTTSSINLRGLGTDKTLVLINGRRVAGVQIESVTSQPDINGLPLAAIDRIEILPTSASGIYGGGALGGVVNVVLKKDYSGGELRATYDNTWDTDSPTRTLMASFGRSLEGGKTHVMLTAQYSDSTPLIRQERRQLADRGIETILRNSPSFLTNTNNMLFGTTPNIGRNGVVLTFDDGTSLNSSLTYIPQGTSPTTSFADLKAGLLRNAGQFNFDPPPTINTKSGLLRPYGSTAETQSLRGTVTRKMTPDLELFVEVAHTANASETMHDPLTGTFVVPASNPNNPFSTSLILVGAPNTLHRKNTSKTTGESVSVGLIAQLPRDWMAHFDMTLSQSETKGNRFSIDNNAITRGLADGTINPFVDTLLYPMPLDQYLVPIKYNPASKLWSAAIRGTGPLVHLNWGTVNLTTAIEHRVASFPDNTSETITPLTPINSSVITRFGREQQIDAAYGELLVPLIRKDAARFVHTLETQIAFRAERYDVETGTPAVEYRPNTSPPSTIYYFPTRNGSPYTDQATYTSSNLTVGFKYQPLPSVTIRASRGTAFLPPSPTQLLESPAEFETPFLINDPKLDSSYTVNVLGGGNPNLKPENSKSFNAGLIWQPTQRILSGLRLTVDWYRITQLDKILDIGAQQFVNLEDDFSGRVTRNSVGQITFINASLVNVTKFETEGWDFGLEHRLSTTKGTFTSQASGSLIRYERRQTALNGPELDYVRYVNDGGPIEFKASFALAWELNNVSAGWNARYVDSYMQSGAPGGPNLFPSTFFTNAQGSDTVSSQVYHDLWINYSFPAHGKQRSFDAQGLLSGLAIQVGVRNVFGTLPPFDVRASDYSSPFGDARLRTYWLTLKKRF